MKAFKLTESNKDYHANTEFISSSGLRLYLKSPEHYLHYIQNGQESKPAYVFGSFYHTSILEPEKLDEEYVREMMKPDQLHGMTAKANKEWRAYIEASGKSVIDEATAEKVEMMKEKLKTSPDLTKLVDKGINEESYYVEGFEGCKVKVRPDKVTANAIIDLKTTDNASTEGFTRTIFKYGYHIQAALYLDVLGQFDKKDRQFVFVAQEKTEPYSYQIFRLSDDIIEYGRWQYKDLLAKHKKCSDEMKWGGYESYNEISERGVTTINLPSWIQY